MNHNNAQMALNNAPNNHPMRDGKLVSIEVELISRGGMSSMVFVDLFDSFN